MYIYIYTDRVSIMCTAKNIRTTASIKRSGEWVTKLSKTQHLYSINITETKFHDWNNAMNYEIQTQIQ